VHVGLSFEWWAWRSNPRFEARLKFVGRSNDYIEEYRGSALSHDRLDFIRAGSGDLD